MFALRVLRWRGSCCVPRQRNGHIVMSSVGVGVSQCATSRFLVSVSGFRTKCGTETAKRPARLDFWFRFLAGREAEKRNRVMKDGHLLEQNQTFTNALEQKHTFATPLMV